MSLRFTFMRVSVGCALLAALFAMGGCYKPVKKVPAFGTVTLDGEPMNEGMLEFIPDLSKGAGARVSCTSRISNGKFDLQTIGMKNADSGSGAPVGWFKVRYFHPGETGLPNDSTPKVAAKFRNEDTTPIVIELTDPAPAEGYKVELSTK